jgi:hypothetical protein
MSNGKGPHRAGPWPAGEATSPPVAGGSPPTTAEALSRRTHRARRTETMADQAPVPESRAARAARAADEDDGSGRPAYLPA